MDLAVEDLVHVNGHQEKSVAPGIRSNKPVTYLQTAIFSWPLFSIWKPNRGETDDMNLSAGKSPIDVVLCRA